MKTPVLDGPPVVTKMRGGAIAVNRLRTAQNGVIVEDVVMYSEPLKLADDNRGRNIYER